MAITAEQLKEIIDLWNAGKSSREIGLVYGVSRNAIVGLIHRARDRGVDVAYKGLPVNTSDEYVPMTRRSKKPKKETVKREAMMLESKLPTIYNLQLGQCKYPTKFSEDHEQLFCAKPAISSYCEKHHKLCYTGKDRITLRNTYKGFGRL